jgi:hypothetical protein
MSKGMPVTVEAVTVERNTFVVSGRFIKTASPKEEWQDDVNDPERVVRTLRAGLARIDLLRFWQRIPETEPKFQYYREWRDVAAIPISTYENWWERQITGKTRNIVRKSQKLGVCISEVEFCDELVRGIMGIFNESPIRRGKPFWHYGKDFATVKSELSADLGEAIFIAAHYNNELIGFSKLLIKDRYAMVTLLLDKKSHRDKSLMNGMIAKAVQLCANREIPYITYTLWRRGDHGRFQERNGFIRIPVPEYFVPITFKGQLAIGLRLHRGIKGLLPEPVTVRLVNLRSWWYSLRQNAS